MIISLFVTSIGLKVSLRTEHIIRMGETPVNPPSQNLFCLLGSASLYRSLEIVALMLCL